ncbi:MAG TPA: HIT family protein [Acidimicrobiales bacterium]|nr:HIT family protein [Acidimicrobiales bacterium]
MGSGIAHQRNVGVTQECIFDGIIAGQVAAHIVLDERDLVAFLDHRPVFDGHTLVVPRTHYARLAEAPESLLGPLMSAGRRVAAAQAAALGSSGALFVLNEVVSQSVPHVHLHVVPRRFGDGLRGFLWPRHRYPSEDAAASLAAKLREVLAGTSRAVAAPPAGGEGVGVTDS